MDLKERVVVVDDHPLFRDRLAQIINHEPDMEVCGEAGDVANALEILQSVSPGFLVVDISLQGTSGLELIKQCRTRGISIPILVLSMHDESLYAERALRAGANGYITKRRGSGEILEAIRRVRKGEVYLSAEMTAIVLRMLPNGQLHTLPQPIDRLTDREIEVLELIGQGRTTREIAATLRLGVATVDTYRARIKEKMDFRNAVELQHFATRWLRERE